MIQDKLGSDFAQLLNEISKVFFFIFSENSNQTNTKISKIRTSTFSQEKKTEYVKEITFFFFSKVNSCCNCFNFYKSRITTRSNQCAFIFYGGWSLFFMFSWTISHIHRIDLYMISLQPKVECNPVYLTVQIDCLHFKRQLSKHCCVKHQILQFT